MLKRRSKRRYLAILHGTDSEDMSREEFNILNSITKRNSELFGHITTELSSVRLIRSHQKNMIIISCWLQYVDNILSTIGLIDPPLVTIVISGTLKRLRRHLEKIVDNTYL
jgi:RNase P/RNase MRP subunit POP5